MQFPQEITAHIAAHMADDLRAVDPSCYRAARILQARWRGHMARTYGDFHCLCHYIDRSFWSHQYGSDVCPSCAVIWGNIEPYDPSDDESDYHGWGEEEMWTGFIQQV